MASKKKRKPQQRRQETVAVKTPAMPSTPVKAESRRPDQRKSDKAALKKSWSRSNIALLLALAWVSQIIVIGAIYAISHSASGSPVLAITSPNPFFLVPACLVFEPLVRRLRHERRMGIMESLSVGFIAVFIVMAATLLAGQFNAPSTSGPVPKASPSAQVSAPPHPSASPTATGSASPSPRPSAKPSASPSVSPSQPPAPSNATPDTAATVVGDVLGYILTVFFYSPLYRFLFKPSGRAQAERRGQDTKPAPKRPRQ